jgi:hypothetical protein
MAKSATRKGNATFVARGYGQVEDNHLSASRNGQVYAQLPAAADIDLLENGQFVKYDYAKGVCDFSTDVSAGPWYMVFNEVKVYEDRETDADFAMIKSNYSAYVYSPIGQSSSKTKTIGTYGSREGSNIPYTAEVEDFEYGAKMPDGTVMVPRVIKVSIGDIFTTNTIKAEANSLSAGDTLKIGADGYLTAGSGAGGDTDPTFVVAKVYTMPDLQPGVKLVRVA